MPSCRDDTLKKPKGAFYGLVLTAHILIAIGAILAIVSLFNYESTFAYQTEDVLFFAQHITTGIALAMVVISPFICRNAFDGIRLFRFIYAGLFAYWTGFIIFWQWLMPPSYFRHAFVFQGETGPASTYYALGAIAALVLIGKLVRMQIGQSEIKHFARSAGTFVVAVAIAVGFCWITTGALRGVEHEVKAGREAFLRCEWDESMECFDRAVAIWPENPIPLLWRAYVLMQAGEYNAALVDLNEVVRVARTGQTKDRSLVYRANAFYELAEYEKSIEACNQGLTLDLYVHWPYYWKGLALDSMGKHLDAIDVLDDGMQVSTYTKRLRNARGWAYYNRGNYLCAAHDLQEERDEERKTARRLPETKVRPKTRLSRFKRNLSHAVPESAGESEKTIAHRMLDTEKEVGIHVPDSAYKLLDTIVLSVRADIGNVNTQSAKDAIRVLRAIARVLRDLGFTYYAGKDMPSLSEGISRKRLNCETYTLIYLGVGEAQGLPIFAAFSPRHMFVRWGLGNNRFLNWETTTGKQEVFVRPVSTQSLAKGVYLKAVDMPAAEAIVYRRKGRYLEKDHRYEDAMESFKATLRLHPQHFGSYISLGCLNYRMGRYEESEKHFTDAIELSGTAETYTPRAYLRILKGEYDSAIADINRALEKNKYSAPAHAQMGEIMMVMHDYPKAVKSFDAAIDADSSNLKYRIWRARAHLRNRNHQAYSLDIDNALSNYNLQIEADPENHHLLTGRATLFELDGKYNEALADLDRALELKPTSYAHRCRGWGLRQKGDFKGAILAFKRAIELEPTSGQNYMRRGYANYMANFDKQAMEDFDVAIQLDPYQAWAYYGRAGINYGLGNYEASVRDLEKLVSIRKWGNWAHSLLFIAHRRAGMNEDSAKEKLMAHRKIMKDAYWEDAAVKYCLGEISDGEFLRQASAIKPMRSNQNRCCALFVIAQHYILAGDLARGLEYLQESISSNASYLMEHKLARLEAERLKQTLTP